ncbi:putative gustatory receptor 28b isoform X2 [Temnothorax longispinosus]
MKQSNPRIRWIAYLSILYRLTIWFSYAYLLHYTITFFTWKALFDTTINSIITTINIITTIISVIMSFYHQKRFEISLKKLSAVDNSLEELGVPMMYQRIHKYSKLVVIGWIAYSLSLNFLDTIGILKYNEWTGLDNSWGLFLAHILNYCFNINAFVDSLFTFFLWYICIRFDKLNEHIRYVLVRQDHELRCTWKKSIVTHRHTLYTNYKKILWTSMHLHLELCRIARELNSIFGIQITFEMTTCFIFITSLAYGICMMLMQVLSKEISQSSYIWINVCLSFFALLIRVYVVNYICESVMIKANEINKIIYQIPSNTLLNTRQYADARKEIYQFTFQAMHHRLKLTGMNLFNLGNECLQKFCITIVTFVIIMVQIEVNISPLSG